MKLAIGSPKAWPQGPRRDTTKQILIELSKRQYERAYAYALKKIGNISILASYAHLKPEQPKDR
jgi:hypothetical protein